MRWNRARREDKTDRLLRDYFEHEIARVEVPPPPRHLEEPAAQRAGQARRWGGAGRRLPDLVCAFALAAGFAVALLHVGRPGPLAGIIEAHAIRYQWTAAVSGSLDTARKTISLGLNGG